MGIPIRPAEQQIGSHQALPEKQKQTGKVPRLHPMFMVDQRG